MVQKATTGLKVLLCDQLVSLAHNDSLELYSGYDLGQLARHARVLSRKVSEELARREKIQLDRYRSTG